MQLYYPAELTKKRSFTEKRKKCNLFLEYTSFAKRVGKQKLPRVHRYCVCSCRQPTARLISCICSLTEAVKAARSRRQLEKARGDVLRKRCLVLLRWITLVDEREFRYLLSLLSTLRDFYRDAIGEQERNEEERKKEGKEI